MKISKIKTGREEKMTLAIQPAHQHKTCPIPDTGSWRMAVMENDLRHLGHSCVSLSCVTAAELLNISEQFSHLKKKKIHTLWTVRKRKGDNVTINSYPVTEPESMQCRALDSIWYCMGCE